METCAELLLQEGHTRALYAIAFHPDGSLHATRRSTKKLQLP